MCEKDLVKLNKKRCKKKVPYLKYAFLLLIPVAFLIVCLNISDRNFIADYLKDNSDYTYDTSITSDKESDLKADVYYTYLTIDDVVKEIVQKAGTLIEDVQSSDDKYSVGILTRYEYAIVYLGEDDKTYIQVSSRAYSYSSSNGLYRPNYKASNSYYRDFYYTFGYKNDSKKYKNRKSSFVGYSGKIIPISKNNEYKNVQSIRQSSLFSRSSSGGGLSSGK